MGHEGRGDTKSLSTYPKERIGYKEMLNEMTVCLFVSRNMSPCVCSWVLCRYYTLVSHKPAKALILTVKWKRAK